MRQHGTRFTEAEIKGRPCKGSPFTHCPEVCPN
ncbi:hypothetical protein [Aminobacter sp. BA135]